MTPVAYQFDCFRIDVATRLLLKDGIPVPLPAKVFDTLVVLVSNYPRAVSKEELIEAVWAGSFVSDDSIAQNISILRRALGDDPGQPRYIATIARHGYRFIPVAVPLTDLPVAHSGDTQTVRAAPVRTWRGVGMVLIAGLVVAVAATIVSLDRRAPDASAALRFEERLPAGEILSGTAAISPDGRSLAYAARSASGVTRIWVRPLDAQKASPLPGTETALMPFWSPDGQFIGFRTPSAVKRIHLSTGTVRVMAQLTVAGVAPGATWAPGDVILYSHIGKMLAISSSGTEPRVVVDAEAGQLAELRWPVALPDGKHFLFFATGSSAERTGTYIGALDSPATTMLLPGVRAVYAPPDYLLYVRDGGLVAQRFDIARAQLAGSVMSIPGDVASAANISASATGVLAITEEAWSEQLAWRDRRGRQLGAIDFPRSLASVRLSPDGRHALAVSNQGEVRELWLIDLARNVSSLLTRNATSPAWAPDSSRFLFTAIKSTGSDLHLKAIKGAAQEAPWLETNEVKVVNSWSPDGRFVVFTKFTSTNQTSQDLWLMPAIGERTPIPFMQTRARESGGQVSPDGRWMAYVSDETGASEVYLQSFPAAGTKIRISTDGGAQPLWRRDGHELFYLSLDGHLMAVSINPGPNPQPGTPAGLFQAEPSVMSITAFAAAADGQRFLVASSRSEGRVTILINWEGTQRP